MLHFGFDKLGVLPVIAKKKKKLGPNKLCLDLGSKDVTSNTPLLQIVMAADKTKASKRKRAKLAEASHAYTHDRTRTSTPITG
jgi:hypothetical protein